MNSSGRAPRTRAVSSAAFSTMASPKATGAVLSTVPATDGTADDVLADAVAVQQVALALGRRTAVAAHGRDNERHRAEALEEADDGAQDGRDVGDATAAGGQGNALPGPDAPAELEPLQL